MARSIYSSNRMGSVLFLFAAILGIVVIAAIGYEVLRLTGHLDWMPALERVGLLLTGVCPVLSLGASSRQHS